MISEIADLVVASSISANSAEVLANIEESHHCAGLLQLLAMLFNSSLIHVNAILYM